MPQRHKLCQESPTKTFAGPPESGISFLPPCSLPSPSSSSSMSHSLQQSHYTFRSPDEPQPQKGPWTTSWLLRKTCVTSMVTRNQTVDEQSATSPSPTRSALFPAPSSAIFSFLSTQQQDSSYYGALTIGTPYVSVLAVDLVTDVPHATGRSSST